MFPCCAPKLCRLAGLVPLLAAPPAIATPAHTADTVAIEYVGHASFLITSASGQRLLTDPFLDHYPLRFPEALSVDVVLSSVAQPDHDAVFQVRGHPALTTGDAPLAAAGFSVTAVGRAGADQARAFSIRSGACTLAFLGEAVESTPEIEALVRDADAVLFNPFAAPPLLRALANRDRPRTLIPLLADSRLGAGATETVAVRLARALPGVPRRSDRRFVLRRGSPTAIVTLERTARERPAAATEALLEGTLARLTWPQVRRAAQEGAAVLLPVGVIEAHGPQLGLGADTYLARHHALRVEEHLARAGVKALVAPPLYWGVMKDTAGFPGSLEVRPETLRALLEDVLASLRRAGFTRVFCAHFHGDRTQNRTIAETVEAQRQADFQAYDLARLDGTGADRRPPGRAGRFEPDIHAGAVETRLILDLAPADVDTRIAKALGPQTRFTPMAYVGEPSAYERESEIPAYFEGLAAADAERVRAVLRAQPLPGAPARTTAGVHDEPGVALIEGSLSAMGGCDRLRAVRSLVRTGTLRQGTAEAPLVVRSAGSKWSLMLQEPGETHQEGFDGTRGWRRDGGSVEEMSAERAALLTSLLAVDGVSALPALRGLRVVAGGPPSQGSRVRLTGETPSGVALELEIDTQTRLLRRIGEAVLDDYREVAGVLWPHRIELAGGRMVVVFDRIEADVPLDDEFAAPPAAAAR